MMFRTEAAIDLNAVEYNYINTRNKLPKDVKILCVVKADAYGHGAVEISKILDDKADFFGVACIEEAVELKKAGIKKPVLVLGYVFTGAYDIAVKYDIRIPVFSYESAKALSDEAVRQNKTVPFHFFFFSLMSSIFFQVNEESADICKKITQLPNIEAEGLFSHFATADEENLDKSIAQQNKFDRFVDMLKKRGIEIPIKHLNNSAGIMNFEKHYDMCRMGIILYGLYPSHEVDKSLLSVKPVMSWLSHISHLKTLEAGREISYGGTYVTTKNTIVATIPVGYADGYPRSLSNIGKAIINGKYAPILGRVCMDQFMVDVTDIDDIKIGTKVTLVGKDGDARLTMEEVSEAASSFNYELPCRISRRVPRTFYKDGKMIEYTNYMY